MSRLMGSVGNGGHNIPSDVKAVQYLLSIRGMSPGKIDKICGKKTIGAIQRYQSTFMVNPDGVVDVDGRTWRVLSGAAKVDKLVRPAPTQQKSPRTRAATPIKAVPAGQALPTARSVEGPGNIKQLIPKPADSAVNIGLSPVNNKLMTKLFGPPRYDGIYTKDGGPLQNERLQRNMVTKNVGPFRVTGLSYAVNSLAAVFADVRREYPKIYSHLTSAGMLNCRRIRGGKGISNHSWGTAIDLGFDGAIDPYGDNKVYFGLAQIAPIFNRHGWYWGVTFGKEDGMHFEASQALVKQWSVLP
jgi:peptidoglycan hydrolase-like protein with peptidoglycan-binding domain